MDALKWCDYMNKKIKESNLHFLLKENPYSIQVTIKKKYVTDPKLFKVKEASGQEIEFLKTTIQAKSEEFELL